MRNNKSSKHVLLVGAGDDSQRRVLPALRHLAALGVVYQIVLADVEACCPLPMGKNGAHCPEHYVQVEKDGLLPQSALMPLGPEALVVMATPATIHVPHIHQVAGTGARIACEKPLCMDISDAEGLSMYRGQLFPIGHYAWKAPMQSLSGEFRLGAWHFDSIDRFEFRLLEREGTRGRAIEHIIWDTGWHGFEAVAALGNAAGIEMEFAIKDVVVSRYASRTEPAPENFTAAFIDAEVLMMGRRVPLEIRVGKGLAEQRKGLILTPNNGIIPHEISLEEFDPAAAHERFLHEMLSEGFPKVPLTLDQNIQIVRACQRACELQMSVDRYAMDTTPAFLRGREALMFSELYVG